MVLGLVFLQKILKASSTASKLEAGQVYVNKWFTGSHAPFAAINNLDIAEKKVLMD